MLCQWGRATGRLHKIHSNRISPLNNCKHSDLRSTLGLNNDMLFEMIISFSSLVPALKSASKSYAPLVSSRSSHSDGWGSPLITPSHIVLRPHRADTPSLINLSD